MFQILLFFMVLLLTVPSSTFGNNESDAPTVDEVLVKIQVPLKIKENEFVIAFPPTREGAKIMAFKFCTDKRKILGISESTFESHCLTPIGKYLDDAVTKHEAGEEIKLPPHLKEQLAPSTINSAVSDNQPSSMISFEVTIRNQNHKISFNRITDNVVDVAKNFCVGKMVEFGLNSVDELRLCTDPIETSVENILKDIDKKGMLLSSSEIKKRELEEKKRLFRERRAAVHNDRTSNLNTKRPESSSSSFDTRSIKAPIKTGNTNAFDIEAEKRKKAEIDASKKADLEAEAKRNVDLLALKKRTLKKEEEYKAAAAAAEKARVDFLIKNVANIETETDKIALSDNSQSDPIAMRNINYQKTLSSSDIVHLDSSSSPNANKNIILKASSRNLVADYDGNDSIGRFSKSDIEGSSALEPSLDNVVLNESENENVTGSNESKTNSLNTSIDQQEAPETPSRGNIIQTTFTLIGTLYPIEIDLSKPSLDSAKAFCRANMKNFGIFHESNIKYCESPVTSFVQNIIDQNV